jgi:hypothetical protein
MHSTQNYYNITRYPDSSFFIRTGDFWGGDVIGDGVERIIFSDGAALAVDVTGAPGQIYRLYRAAFDRTPDLGGIGNWIAASDGGMSMTTIASSFIQSTEFKNKYGSNPTSDHLVNLLYQNVLHRAPDPAGYASWVGLLNAGTETTAQVLAGFSESPENQANVIGVIANGIHYTYLG